MLLPRMIAWAVSAELLVSVHPGHGALGIDGHIVDNPSSGGIVIFINRIKVEAQPDGMPRVAGQADRSAVQPDLTYRLIIGELQDVFERAAIR